MTKNVISAITARISVTTKVIRVGAFSVNMLAPIRKSECQNKSQRRPVTVKAAALHSGSRLERDHNGEKGPPVLRLNVCGVCVYESGRSQRLAAPPIAPAPRLPARNSYRALLTSGLWVCFIAAGSLRYFNTGRMTEWFRAPS